ncbi:MAG: signal recognition particle-docking protein FtsY [Clostridia bacterium]|nr:signal recognition particle-docking protein FtsY [Clostridia bacterium]
MGFFEKLKEGLKKTKDTVFKQVTSLFSRYTTIDDELYEELEEILITSDVGVSTTEEILERLQDTVRSERITEPEEARRALMRILADMIGDGEPLNLSTSPAVVLVIGVNGVGKTTSIAKIANLLKKDGKTVLLAAADTFRAAAIDQIAVWADRVGVDLIRHDEGSDPASVVYDAVNAAKSRRADVLIVDTAGRLHNKKNLMDELAKINRVISRELPDAARETLLILDATTGQNAVIQASEFKNAANITGLVLTKLDGTAKGGIVFSIKQELNIPVKYIGVGEQMDDLQMFDSELFVRAMFDEENA